MADLTVAADVDTFMGAASFAAMRAAMGVPGLASNNTFTGNATFQGGDVIVTGTMYNSPSFYWRFFNNAPATLGLSATANIFWTPTNAAGVADLGIGRNAANVLEVNNGTPGTFAAIRASAFLAGYATTLTAAAITTLVAGSPQNQYFTGTTTQNCDLPVTSTLVLGQSFRIINDSTGVVTIRSSGGNTVTALAAGHQATVTCILTSGTTAASWHLIIAPAVDSAGYVTMGGSGAGLAVNGATGNVFFTTSSETRFRKLIWAAGGSLPSPGIAFESDPDTGIYSTVANVLSIGTGGVLGWTVLSGAGKASAYTVATLPAAATVGLGGIVAVSDATQAVGTALGTAPTGGGAVKRMVYCDGAAWLLL